MDIGEPRRRYVVEPLEEPVPQEEPDVETAEGAEPAAPETEPAPVP